MRRPSRSKTSMGSRLVSSIAGQEVAIITPVASPETRGRAQSLDGHRSKKKRSVRSTSPVRYRVRDSLAKHGIRIPLPHKSSLYHPWFSPTAAASTSILLSPQTASSGASPSIVMSRVPSTSETLVEVCPQAQQLSHGIDTGSPVASSKDHLDKAERYRRCQSLVDIHDDQLFKELVEGLPEDPLASDQVMDSGDIARPVDTTAGSLGLMVLPRRASQANSIGESDESAGVLITRSMSLPESQSRARRDHVHAWFITREIVQGEKRYGRLLAKGVAIRESLISSASISDSDEGAEETRRDGPGCVTKSR
ncbi:hypothetical protein BD324DRAFT_402830 [Kockovaella imperatae]|uniref:Uncharacterized protein n=1 Tax=Kockovaella imperatae TaxID=4999 RepID=A0A1Y1UIH5_9TREE|nr:hypothetical protein BD324DRAFT_402830 [Kockovaella imperatae]ORX37848.1 hypothetical protein BD324DRAFT_402830 [Kockovaella imperatae]